MAEPPALGKEAHLDAAERIFALAESSDKVTGDARAWTIVFEFYAAVHWVRAFIRMKDPSARIASHDDVKHAFYDMPELGKIKRSYDFLKQASHSVRYYGVFGWPPGDYSRTRQAARQVRSWSLPLCTKG
jgi:hypothetical protein